MSADVMAAHDWSTNGHLIWDLVRLGYLNAKDYTLDTTYGRGVWWKLWQPGRLLTNGWTDDPGQPPADIDLVVVSTPHDLHTGPVVAAAEAGKHVIIEKPVALTMDDVRKQQAAVNKTGVKTIVSFVLTWNPLLMTIDELIRTGALGNVFMVEVDYMHRIWCGAEKWLGSKKQAGSSFLAGGCHAVSAMQWFARSEAVEVCAYSVQTENPNDYPGTTTAVVKFADGKIGRTTSCFDAQMPYVFNIGVYGTEGSVRNDKVFAPKLFPGQNAFMTVPCALPESGDVTHHPVGGEGTHFVDCILENKKPFPNLDDAVQTMAV